MLRQKVSAFVISYNREDTISTVLKALAFVDELILVDKSSTDQTVMLAAPFVDRVVVVPWSPTADDTREYAESLCTHDRIVFLDDDEVLNGAAIQFICDELEAPRADIYCLPLRHYILGLHDDNAYYWPEHHVRFYKRGAIGFSATTHNMIQRRSEDVFVVPAESGACIHHLSHKNVRQWIDKTNRYTSQVDRTRMVDADPDGDILTYAHRAIERWAGRSTIEKVGGYVATVALARATYDIIDRLKVWEEENGIDGDAEFRRVCLALEAEYRELPSDLWRIRTGIAEQTKATVQLKASAPAETSDSAIASRQLAALKARMAALESGHSALREENERMKATASWRLTRPLRDFRSTLRRWFGV